MSLWNTFKGYVSAFEQSIDAQFAQKEGLVEENNVHYEDISDTEPIEEQTENEKEKGNEADDTMNEEEKKKKFVEKIKEIESELEIQNQEFERLQKTKDSIGTTGESLLREFDERQTKQLKKFQLMKELETQLTKEIAEHSGVMSDLDNAQSENSSLQQQISELQNHLSLLNNQYKQIMTQDSEASASISKLSIAIEDSKLGIKTKTQELLETKQNAELISKQMQEELKELDGLTKTSAELESQLTIANNAKNSFIENESQLTARLTDLKKQLEIATVTRQQQINDDQRQTTEAMRNFSQTLIQQKEAELEELKIKRQRIAEEISHQQEQNEQEIKDLSKLISDSEIEFKELQNKLKDAKNSLPRMVEPFQMQIDSLKSIYETNQEIEQNVQKRLTQNLAEVEAKFEAVKIKCQTLKEKLDELSRERVSIKSESNRISKQCQEHLKLIEDNVEHIEIQKKLNLEYESQVHSCQANLRSLQSRLEQMNMRIKSIEMTYAMQLKEMTTKLDQLNLKIQKNDATPHNLLLLHELTQECNEIDIEFDSKIQQISKQAGIQHVFDQTVGLIAEKQELIDQLQKLMDKERASFKEKIAKLMK